MRCFAVLGCALVAGCAFDRGGTGTVADAAIALETDSGSIPETTADVEVVPDTAPPPPPIETVTIETSALGAAARTIDLTAEGTLDWAHWGHTTTESFNRKNGVDLIANEPASGATTFESSVLRFTWTDGAPPNAMVTETPRGLIMSTAGEYASFDVNGDETAERRLDVWVSGTSDATLTGSLTTKSANATLAAGVYLATFRFRAAGKLRVEVKKGPTLGSFNLFAAALK